MRLFGGLISRLDLDCRAAIWAWYGPDVALALSLPRQRHLCLRVGSYDANQLSRISVATQLNQALRWMSKYGLRVGGFPFLVENSIRR